MDIKQDFARRLAKALDYAGVSTRMIERKRYLASIAKVSERHAGNYLAGAKLPTPEGMIDLAIRLGVSWDWLATGRGWMVTVNLTEEEILTLQAMTEEERSRFFQIGKVLADPKAPVPSLPRAA